MPEVPVTLSERQIQLKTLDAARERLYKKVRSCYKLLEEFQNDTSRIGQFKIRCATLSHVYEEFHKVINQSHSLALTLDANAPVEGYEDEIERFEQLYYQVLEVYGTCKPSATVPPLSVNQTGGGATLVTAPPMSVRLPQIELRKFDGTLKEWPAFRSLFESVIHANENVTTTAKFHYLKSCLIGPAAISINQIPITEGNYEIAWASLVKRYTNNRMLGFELVKKLMNFSVIKKETGVELSNFVAMFSECFAALRALPIQDLANFIMLHQAMQCLPIGTQKGFERAHDGDAIPTVDDLLKFVQRQIHILELCKPNGNSTTVCDKKGANNETPGIKHAFMAKPMRNQSCKRCSQNHFIMNCAQFQADTVDARLKVVKENHLCYNCLSSTHNVRQCSVKHRCKRCGFKHHSLLHLESSTTSNGKAVEPGKKASQKGDQVPIMQQGIKITEAPEQLRALTSTATQYVLLGTAVIHVRGVNNQFFKVRALIDSGANSSFMTESCAARLGLNVSKITSAASGLADQQTETTGMVTCFIKPVNSKGPILDTDTMVLPKITSTMPTEVVPRQLARKFRHLQLADPKFDQPAEIDFLIGADNFPYIYTGERIISSQTEPAALKSIFGWVITGRNRESTVLPERLNNRVFLSNVSDPLDKIMRKFWEIEEINVKIPVSSEELLCEEEFQNITKRDDTGRYSVPILEKHEHPELGHSYELAKSRLVSLERRLERQPKLKNDYAAFMHEYENLGHMELVSGETGQADYYIPHHCVIKEDSSTTKLRVVFDASMKTTSGTSLNDILCPGSKLQQDIIDVIFKFRGHKIVFTADICKMYRQILIEPSHRTYQHILWRDNPNEPINEYQLNTVTYGLTSSPFPAIRTLKQLAYDEGTRFPEAAQVLCHDTFVDDILTGAQTEEQAILLQQQLIDLLKSGGFELRKWSSNSAAILATVPHEHRETPIEFSDEPTTKILGIYWNSMSDIFSYKIVLPPITYSKRGLLSVCARIYDPMGWVAPVVFKIKVFIQQLWLAGLEWDSPVPDTLKNEWGAFFEGLSDLSLVRLERNYSIENCATSRLIGFCDASGSGYGAVVYLVTHDALENTKINLLLAKTKVAPVKTISIPRLELSGAVLLTALIEKAVSLLQQTICLNEVLTFSDSTVVLDWIRMNPCTLKTFVANRVTLILEKTSPEMWHHVNSRDNPADIASRGCQASQIIGNKLWWSGPPWLSAPRSQWPITQTQSNASDQAVQQEVKAVTQLCLAAAAPKLNLLTEKYSSFWKLVHVTAWILRFFNNLRVEPSKRKFRSLSAHQRNDAERRLATIVERQYFADIIQKLKTGQPVSKNFQGLSPFLDTNGMLRVGGRLRNAPLSDEQKHPILLPQRAPFVDALIDDYHKFYLHVGPRTLQSLIARKYWIISARQRIRARLRRCIPCFKAKPRAITPKMSDLPEYRVSQSRPFFHVGTDFGGPFYCKDTSLRKARITKVYVCLFICMATKAVHLELISNLSTPAFIAALDRFVGRRGLCQHIYSDNGATYIGAKNVLNEIRAYLSKSPVQTEISDYASQKGITWTFIPPAAPNFGGLWEAGIKSMKYHLKRVIGDQSLTFEELSTILIKIEAMLNSRPLCPLSDDPNELDVLTPGHFLIGAPLVARPELEAPDNIASYRTRWQLISNISQHFWKRWTNEYIHTLAQRSKWTRDQNNIEIGQLVLIQEPHLPSTKWMMGRVAEVFPGRDNIVRVVTVKTATGTLRRPVSKLSPLPLDISPESDLGIHGDEHDTVTAVIV